MSYQVLARKWRPRDFNALVGQEHVLRALVNALDNGRLHHAYLFTGTRGVGKTTIARILARCLNCETGVTSTPCGQCPACQEITEGRFIDLIEVDAASKTRVEDTRELLDNVQYAPTKGRYKVYLIDEVHMLSTHSFNALLKTLEEPPPHVKFLLATTDPQKLPVTILSRCLQFNLKNMSPEKIVGHLTEVFKAENVSFEEGALWQLGRAAEGSMRDALSLTDQAIAYGRGQVTDQHVTAMLGAINQAALYELLTALAAGDGTKMLAVIEHLSEFSPDYHTVLTDLLAILHRIAVAQVVPDAVDNAQGDKDKILTLAQQLPGEDVQLFYQMGLIGRRDLSLAPDPRSGLEMTLLRMLAFKPQGVIQTPTAPLVSNDTSSTTSGSLDTQAKLGKSSELNKPNELSQLTALDKTVVPHQQGGTTTKKSKPPAPIAQVEKPRLSGAAVDDEIAQDMSQNKGGLPVEPAPPPPVADNGLDSSPTTSPDFSLTTSSDDSSATSLDDLPTISLDDSPPTKVAWSELTTERWWDVYQTLPVKGVLKTIAANCEVATVADEQIRFVLAKQYATLYNDSYAARLAKTLQDYFGRAIQITIDIDDVKSETPAARIIRQRQERQNKAETDFKNNQHVQQMLDVFSGVLVDDSIRPLD